MTEFKLASYSVDPKTDDLLSGLSAKDINALEKEFENLCDLSPSSSRGNSVSNEPGEGLVMPEKKPDDKDLSESHNRDTPPFRKSNSRSAHGPIASQNKDESNKLKIATDIRRPSQDTAFQPSTDTSLKDTTIEGRRHPVSRAERRRQYYTKGSDSSKFSQSLDESTRIDEAIAVCDSGKGGQESDVNKPRRPSLQADIRRSKLNAPDDTHEESTSRTRLTRRRISRDGDDDNAQPRLTARRLDSVDSDQSASSKSGLPKTASRDTGKDVTDSSSRLTNRSNTDREAPATTLITKFDERRRRSTAPPDRDVKTSDRPEVSSTRTSDLRTRVDRRASPKRDLPRSTPDKELGKRPALTDRSRVTRSSPRSTPDREITTRARNPSGDDVKSRLTTRSTRVGNKGPSPDKELDRPTTGARASKEPGYIARTALTDRSRTGSPRSTPERESDDKTAKKEPRTGTTRSRLGSDSDAQPGAQSRYRTRYERSRTTALNSDEKRPRPRRHQDLEQTETKKSDSSGEERQALLSSMKKSLEELKDLRKNARGHDKVSDSSGDERLALRHRRHGEPGAMEVHPPIKTESSSEDNQSKRLVRTPLMNEPEKAKQPSREIAILESREKADRDSKLVLGGEKPSASSTDSPTKTASERESTDDSTVAPLKDDKIAVTIAPRTRSSVLEMQTEDPPQTNGHRSREQTPKESTDSDRSDIVLPKRLPRTEITKFDSTPSIQTNFCVDYLAGRRTSLPKNEATELRRHSLKAGDDTPVRGKGLRRSGSLRTVQDRSWIRDQSDDDKVRNVEIPRRDSLRNEDQAWIRDQTTERRGSLLADQPRRDSFTSEEIVVLRGSRRPSEDVVDGAKTVDDEIEEVRSREGHRAEDDRTRLSVADKLKLFSDAKEKSPPPQKPSVTRRKKRYNAQRFQTQPITLEEVEKAGKITPRPVSLVVTEKDSKQLEQALSDRSSTEKELAKGPQIEVPREDSTEFFTSDSKPIKISVDSDAFDDVFLCSQDLLDIRRRPKPKRRVASKQKRNPIKALQARDDLQDAYTEIKIVDVKKIKRQQVDNKTGFAEAALQGLASVENFNKISLKKRTETKKSTDPYSNLMLVLIKGRHDIQVRLVEPKASSLCSGDCYVLITPEKIYCWLGKFGNIIEKAKAHEFANLLFKHKGMGFNGEKDVIVIEESDSERKKEFWELLGGFDEYLKEETDDELYEFRLNEMNIIYQLQGETLVPDAGWCGQQLRFEMLQDHSKVIVFDFGTELYVWNGPKCSFDDRKRGLQLAKRVWENGVEYKESPNPLTPFKEGTEGYKGTRPDWCIFGKINHNMETQLFKEKFSDWPESGKIISVKVEKKEEKEQVELVPCDVSAMLQPNREEVTLVLEGTHVGRGRQWVDRKDDFIKKDFDIVTIKTTCWLVREYDHHIMDDDSYGQFHDADTYVIRWQYMVMPSVKNFRGKAARQSLTGRERCAYFFWQGRNSTVNEKGASALMTVELDAERGPQVRVVQGQEPPAFTQLFDGKMIVHLGKRGCDSGSWKLYVLRNEIKFESYLLEVPCAYYSLRSRSSFILLNLESGLNYVWHGAKAPQQTRKSALEIAECLGQSFPKEIGMKVPIEDPVEMIEGKERRKMFLAFKDVDTNAVALAKDLSFKKANAPDYKMSPRLFHLTAVSGVFESLEILNNCRSEYISPLPFTQDQLYDRCTQPGLYILDIGTKVYVWQGWWPDGFDEGDNLQTGSARARFSRERKLVLETAVAYCARKEIPGEMIIAGYESEKFTDLFPSWEPLPEARTNNTEENDRLNGVSDLKELLSRYDRSTYTYAELIQKPEGIDPSKIEKYLCDEEFEMVFRMTKEAFYETPAWKQIAMRKSTGLF